MTKDNNTLGSAIVRAVADTGLTAAISSTGTPGGARGRNDDGFDQ
jgi:hypothetical protein